MEEQVQQQPHTDDEEHDTETDHTFWEVDFDSVGPAHAAARDLYAGVRPHCANCTWKELRMEWLTIQFFSRYVRRRNTQEWGISSVKNPLDAMLEATC